MKAAPPELRLEQMIFGEHRVSDAIVIYGVVTKDLRIVEAKVDQWPSALPGRHRPLGSSTRSIVEA